MNHITLIVFGFLTLSCAQENTEKKVTDPVTEETVTETNYTVNESQLVKETEPYQLSLKMDPVSGNNYLLTLHMELEPGAHYVSPNSPGDFSGIFSIIMDENSQISLKDGMTETPVSIETKDPFQGLPVNFVTESTTHTQQIEITSLKDFEIRGKVQFTIEPRCTLEENWFTIISKNGVITVQQ